MEKLPVEEKKGDTVIYAPVIRKGWNSNNRYGAERGGCIYLSVCDRHILCYLSV